LLNIKHRHLCRFRLELAVFAYLSALIGGEPGFVAAQQPGKPV
jgi:hypothetical protein